MYWANCSVCQRLQATRNLHGANVVFVPRGSQQQPPVPSKQAPLPVCLCIVVVCKCCRPLASQEGFWSWLSGVTDNSVYPVLILSNLQVFFPGLASGWPRTLFLLTVSLSLSYLNYR